MVKIKNAFLSNSINEVFNNAFHSPPANEIANMHIIECKNLIQVIEMSILFV